MTLNKKAASLHQSMESWIELYKTIHECNHNDAHDAFDEWTEKLQGESANQTSDAFHDAVVASHAEMRKGFVEEHFPATVHHCHSVKKKLVATGSMDRLVHIDDDIAINFKDGVLPKGPIGGPLIELSYGKQPQTAIARQHYIATIGDRTEVAGVSHRPVTFKPVSGPIGGPILDTGRDPLSFKDEAKLVPQPMAELDTADTREKAEKAIELNTSFLINTKHAPDHPAVTKARGILVSARLFLEILDGVEERAKERTGRVLSLKGKK